MILTNKNSVDLSFDVDGNSDEKKVRKFKRTIKRKDGNILLADLTIIEIESIMEQMLFCVHIKNITEQKQHAAELLQAQRLTKSILDASFDALFHVNESGIIQMVNEAAFKIFGWTKDELLGSNISIIMGKEHAEKHDGYVSRYLKTGEKRVMDTIRENVARRKDGSAVVIELGLTEVSTEKGEERVFCGFVKDITKRKEGELKFMRQQRLVMGIINASFDALFNINEKGIIQMANEAAVRDFGWTKEEFIGSNISMITGEEHASKHDEYIARYLQTGEKRVMGKVRELPARRKDGSKFLIELGLTEVVTEMNEERSFCGFVKNITQRKKYEKELLRREQLNLSILEAAFDALFTIDQSGIIQTVNETAVNQFGWSRDEFIGQNINMIMPSEHAEKHDHYIATYLKTGIKRVAGTKREVIARRKDGSEFPVELGLTEVNVQGEDRLFCGFLRDLTQEKKLLQTEIEKKSAEALLLNILPENIALRLKGIFFRIIFI